MKSLPEKNQAYYLREQAAEKHEMPWFRYVKTMEQYSEPVLVTPEMAKELLRNTLNRINIRKSRPKSEEIENQISLSLAGRLVDGQHILDDIVQAEKAQSVMINFNISDKLSSLFS